MARSSKVDFPPIIDMLIMAIRILIFVKNVQPSLFLKTKPNFSVSLTKLSMCVSSILIS